MGGRQGETKKITAEALLSRTKSNSYKKGPHPEEDSPGREKARGHNQERSNSASNRYVMYETNSPRHGGRSIFSGMQNDSVNRALSILNEVSARQHCRRGGFDAPNLATVKDFLSLYATTSCGKVVEIPIAGSVSTYQWFFAVFTHVTGTPQRGKIGAKSTVQIFSWTHGGRILTTVRGPDNPHRRRSCGEQDEVEAQSLHPRSHPHT